MFRTALLIALLLAPVASAGTPDAPEVTDPAGDAGPNGSPAPAGFEDLDILAAWFEGETKDTIDLKMNLAAAPRNRPNTIWAQAFDVNGTSKVAGWGDFFMQGSAFLCDYEGGTSVTNCIIVDGAVDGTVVRATLPKANLSNPSIGDSLTITGGNSLEVFFVPVDVVAFGQAVTFDTTPPGIPYIFAKGEIVVDTVVDTLPNAAGTPAAGTNLTPQAGPGGEAEPTNNLPAAPVLLLALATLATALLARRKA